jgi:hypothetical protein
MPHDNEALRLSTEPRITTVDPYQRVHDGQTWGPWQFKTKYLTLHHQHYEIDLKTCTSSAETLDWIFQVSRKAWCSPQDAGYLLKAFHALLGPQHNLCRWGNDKPFDPTAHLKALLAKSQKPQ